MKITESRHIYFVIISELFIFGNLLIIQMLNLIVIFLKLKLVPEHSFVHTLAESY